jgi:hypothetical protein
MASLKSKVISVILLWIIASSILALSYGPDHPANPSGALLIIPLVFCLIVAIPLIQIAVGLRIGFEWAKERGSSTFIKTAIALLVANYAAAIIVIKFLEGSASALGGTFVRVTQVLTNRYLMTMDVSELLLTWGSVIVIFAASLVASWLVLKYLFKFSRKAALKVSAVVAVAIAIAPLTIYPLYVMDIFDVLVLYFVLSAIMFLILLWEWKSHKGKTKKKEDKKTVPYLLALLLIGYFFIAGPRIINAFSPHYFPDSTCTPLNFGDVMDEIRNLVGTEERITTEIMCVDGQRGINFGSSLHDFEGLDSVEVVCASNMCRGGGLVEASDEELIFMAPTRFRLGILCGIDDYGVSRCFVVLLNPEWPFEDYE